MSRLEPTTSQFVVSAAAEAARHLERTRHEGPGVPVGADEIRRRLAVLDPETSMDPHEALAWFVDFLGSSVLHTTSPRYFGLFNPSPTAVGVVGDLLTAAFNPQLAAWSHAPGPVELERWFVEWLGDRLGLGRRAGGTFTTGGAEANATGLQVALHRTLPDHARHGVRSAAGQPTIYVSEASHDSWAKAARAAGLGTESVRRIPTGRTDSMEPSHLAGAIEEDRDRGCVPVIVVATAGTTSAGAIDPLVSIASVAESHAVHLHVDAAWGGAAVMSDRARSLLAGIERADSVTVDAHKWLSAPMGAGIVLVRARSWLAETFDVNTDYMPSRVADTVDPYRTSMQWSRRFIGLKVIMQFVVGGRAAYAEQIEHDIDLGARLRRMLIDAGWSIENDTGLPVVCFSDPTHPDDHEWNGRIVDEVVASGDAWISLTRVSGRSAIRACVTSHRSSDADLQRLTGLLGAARTG